MILNNGWHSVHDFVTDCGYLHSPCCVTIEKVNCKNSLLEKTLFFFPDSIILSGWWRVDRRHTWLLQNYNKNKIKKIIFYIIGKYNIVSVTYSTDVLYLYTVFTFISILKTNIFYYTWEICCWKWENFIFVKIFLL